MDVKLNAFDHEVPRLAECVRSELLLPLLHRQLLSILPIRDDGGAQELAQQLFETTAANSTDESAADAVQELLLQAGALEYVRGGLADRTSRIIAQVKPHVIGTKVFDYGCGNGEVGRSLSDLGYTVFLSDVKDYRTEAARRLSWQLISDIGAYPPPDGGVDSLLLLTVLHHCVNPESTLRRVQSLRPKRVVSIESVFDLTENDVSLGNQIKTCKTADAMEWLRLPRNEQFRYACFWDWFYNKVINSGVVVPYNYSSPNAWQQRFGAIGYSEVKRIYLGIDQPLVPEFHVLQVFDAASSQSVQTL
jgi:SAM-dependent methyltransferase